MRLLEINLATRPFRNNTLYWAGFGSAALILAALTGVNIWLFLQAGSSVQQYGQEVLLKQAKRDALLRDEKRLSVKLTKLDFKGLARQAEFANDAIRRRVFSWTELFNRLEEVVPPAVMMTAIRPEIQAEGISIVGEGMAKDQEGLLDFEENLIRSAYFSGIYPGSERREQRGGDLHFSLKFDYVPGGRPDASGAPVTPAEEPDKTERSVAQDVSAPPQPPAAAETPPTLPPAQNPAPVTQVAAPPPGAVASAPQPPAGLLAAPATTPSTATTQNSAAPAVSPPAPSGRAPSPAPGTRRPNPADAKRGRPAGRPLLKPGSGARIGSQIEPRPDGRAARTETAMREAAVFENRPLEDVIDYLMKNRTMTFVFDGSFDLRQKVDMDVFDKPQAEIAEMIAGALGAIPSMEAENTWKFIQMKPAETLEQPPVEEQPVPEEPPPAEEPPAEEPPKEDGG